jgi:polyphosphate glucokinase
MKTLVIDIGGTNVKILATDQVEARKIPSGPTMSAQSMVEAVLEQARDWPYDRISVGYPGPVAHGNILKEPRNLAPGWIGFDFAAKLGKPVKLINDAAMQALGSYDGGRMLFLGLGTGLGSALIINQVVAPLELAHLPYKKERTFEDYLGERGLERLGRKKWQRAVEDVIARLKAALVADTVVLGGGNVKKLDALPPGCRQGDNRNAFIGGYRLWDGYVDG